MLLLLLFTVASAQISKECQSHRLCAFGFEKAYESTANYLYDITGCEDCKQEPTTCTCRPNSDVQLLITNQSFCDNSICSNAIAQHALRYAPLNLDCEQGFEKAQEYLIQLCGTINGICCNGNCNKPYQIDQPQTKCKTHQGHSALARWILTAYIIISIALFQWSNELDMDFLNEKK